VWSHKGPTLKGIRYCNHPQTKLFFPGPRSDTFWTDLVVKKITVTIVLSTDTSWPTLWCCRKSYTYSHFVCLEMLGV
jgi:hypothetical protein